MFIDFWNTDDVMFLFFSILEWIFMAKLYFSFLFDPSQQR